MGQFTITSAVLEDEELARAIYHDMIVYKVEHDVAVGVVDVWAVHPDFAEVSEAFAPNKYHARIEDVAPGEYTVTWKP